MASALIVAGEDDFHAAAMQWALTSMGHRAYVWQPTESAGLFSASLSAGQGPRIEGPLGPEHTYDVAWIRRPKALAPTEGLDPADRAYLSRENDFFLCGWLSAAGALLANEVGAGRRANFKLEQLVVAQRVGLQVPPTLSSNDLESVRDFVRSAPGRVIYKTHSPAVWSVNGKNHAVYTTCVDLADLDRVDQSRFNPGIFQHFIAKAFELRVSIFGDALICAKIDDCDEIDWRTSGKMRVTPHTLPDAVADKLRVFMRAMGLVMGMIDLIVTPEGDHIFLEVNEQGQFLWIELENPEIPVMAACAGFLAGADGAGAPSLPPLPTVERYLQSSAYEQYVGLNKLDVRTSSWVIMET